MFGSDLVEMCSCGRSCCVCVRFFFFLSFIRWLVRYLWLLLLDRCLRIEWYRYGDYCMLCERSQLCIVAHGTLLEAFSLQAYVARATGTQWMPHKIKYKNASIHDMITTNYSLFSQFVIVNCCSTWQYMRATQSKEEMKWKKIQQNSHTHAQNKYRTREKSLFSVLLLYGVIG